MRSISSGPPAGPPLLFRFRFPCLLLRLRLNQTGSLIIHWDVVSERGRALTRAVGVALAGGWPRGHSPALDADIAVDVALVPTGTLPTPSTLHRHICTAISLAIESREVVVL
jgi:hypothetical protein